MFETPGKKYRVFPVVINSCYTQQGKIKIEILCSANGRQGIPLADMISCMGYTRYGSHSCIPPISSHGSGFGGSGDDLRIGSIC